MTSRGHEFAAAWGIYYHISIARILGTLNITHAGKGVYYAWSTNTYAYSWLSREIAVSCSSIDRSLFVPERYETDSEVEALLTNVNDR